MEDLLQVGVITSTHGIKGEVKVFPTTDDNNRFKKLKECYIEYKNEMLPVEVLGCKFFKNMVILKFKGIDNINDVEKYKQCKLFVDRAHAVKLEDGSLLGTLTEIIPTGANDVYVVTGEDKREWLLPAIKECILNVDMENRKMTICLMKGMEE